MPSSSSGGYNPLLYETPAERARLVLDECRNGRYAAYDPALGCLMHADTDDAAAACLDGAARAIVHGASSH